MDFIFSLAAFPITAQVSRYGEGAVHDLVLSLGK